MTALKQFLISEEGELVEWIIGTLIIGLGAIPIILGIASAINKVSAAGEEEIRNMIY